MTASVTRSVEIDAPVEKVFAFVSDPKQLLEQSFPLSRRVTVSDVATTPEGVVTGFTWSMRFPLLPFDVHASCTRLEHTPNERLVDKYSTGDLTSYTVAPSGDGTRLTSTTEIAWRIPLMEKLEDFVFMPGRSGLLIDRQLELIRRRVENPDDPPPLTASTRSASRAGLRIRRGSFRNGMTYARVGDGPKSLLWLAEPTKGPMLAMMMRVARPFVADGYSVWLVSLRPDMPTGHTLVDMADDYATLINEEFAGRVDLVVGHSTGGMVGFCLAAGHPDRFGHIVIAGAGLWSDRADRANLETAQLLVDGRTRDAADNMARLLFPAVRPRVLARMIGLLVGKASLTVYSAEDLLVSAEATHAFNPLSVLPSIGVPVLLIAGDKDVWFGQDDVEQAAQLIPDCTLRVYPNTNHFGAITSPCFVADALEFTQQRQPATR